MSYANLAYAIALQALKDNDYYFFSTEFYCDVIQPLMKSDRIRDVTEMLHRQGFRYFHSKFRRESEIRKMKD